MAASPSASERQAQAMSTDIDAKFTDDVNQGDTNTEIVQTVQDQFEVYVRREPSQSTMTGYIDKLDIISLNNDPTTLTGVLINRGNCRTKGFFMILRICTMVL